MLAKFISLWRRASTRFAGNLESYEAMVNGAGLGGSQKGVEVVQ